MKKTNLSLIDDIKVQVIKRISQKLAQETSSNAISELSSEIQQIIDYKVSFAILNDIEMQTIKYLCKGYSTNQIAGYLSKTPRTINYYKEKILTKLNLEKISEVIILYTKAAMLDTQFDKT